MWHAAAESLKCRYSECSKCMSWRHMHPAMVNLKLELCNCLHSAFIPTDDVAPLSCYQCWTPYAAHQHALMVTLGWQTPRTASGHPPLKPSQAASSTMCCVNTSHAVKESAQTPLSQVKESMLHTKPHDVLTTTPVSALCSVAEKDGSGSYAQFDTQMHICFLASWHCHDVRPREALS